MTIKTVTVIGATGTMGANIAGIFAAFGDAKVYCVGRDIEKIKNNILKAGEVALNNKTAIAIGHVGPEGGEVTASALKELAAELERMGVKLVTVSELKKIKGL